MRLIFIGGGNMAEAIFSRLEKINIVVIQRNLQKLSNLKNKYHHIHFISQLNFPTDENDLIFLAVKPQDARTACLEIRDNINSSTIISVMAGISCQSLQTWLGSSKICRVMPNTPSMLGLGVSGIYFCPEITNQHIITKIFEETGKVYILNNEDQINQITAVAASSPAYVFYFIEALINAAITQFSMDEETARAITLQVVKGSLALIEKNNDISITQLRQNVTSKKGTTECAIKILEKYQLTDIINEAQQACYQRAIELSALFADE